MLTQQPRGTKSPLRSKKNLVCPEDDPVCLGMPFIPTPDIVIMNFSKAFDKVSHSGLLFKLSELGASEEVCQWAKSFLVSRTQRVVVDGVASECEAVTSGVPQGSVLGPIFFLVYINDMAKCTKHSSVRLFADDTIIYKAVKAVSDCEFLQEDLDAFLIMG